MTKKPEQPVQVVQKKTTFVGRSGSPEPAPPVGGEHRLRPEQELFFEMSLGSVYESSGRDEIAIS